MKMQIVKDGMFKREYYRYYEGLKEIELFEYSWDSSIEKYVLNFNMIVDKLVSKECWEKFKEEKREKGFLSIEEVLKIGVLRP